MIRFYEMGEIEMINATLLAVNIILSKQRNGQRTFQNLNAADFSVGIRSVDHCTRKHSCSYVFTGYLNTSSFVSLHSLYIDLSNIYTIFCVFVY